MNKEDRAKTESDLYMISHFMKMGLTEEQARAALKEVTGTDFTPETLKQVAAKIKSQFSS